jgi:hypothetical protein
MLGFGIIPKETSDLESVFCFSLSKDLFFLMLLACCQLVAHPVGSAAYVPALTAFGLCSTTRLPFGFTVTHTVPCARWPNEQRGPPYALPM